MIISLWTLGLLGCDQFTGLTANLNGRARDTHMFWARLQGIHIRDSKDVSNLIDASYAQLNQYEVDGVAGEFSKLSEKLAQLAMRLKALEANNVDPLADDYRQRLAGAYQSLSDEYRTIATATKNRDFTTLAQRNPTIRALVGQFVGVCNERVSIMSQLSSRYNRDFNVME